MKQYLILLIGALLIMLITSAGLKAIGVDGGAWIVVPAYMWAYWRSGVNHE